jgi:hypothetical protein
MKDYYAKCGANCGRCPLFVENLTDDKRQWIVDGMARYFNWHLKPERLRACAGCQVTEGYHYLVNCPVRQCAFYNAVETCASCAVFPCQDVPGVTLSTDFRDQVAERLGEPVPEEAYLAFIEPFEGMAHLEEIRAKLPPEDLIPPQEVKPLRSRLAAFPEDLELSEREVTDLRSLYYLMTRIIRGEADLRVRQLYLKKLRNWILNTFWVFGRFGEFIDGETQLVIDGDKWASEKGVTLVRKRDNALHGDASRCVELLADYSVVVKFEPLGKKTWKLYLTNDDAEGAGMLRALKDYITALVEAYGAPEYAGSNKYKGEAYAQFSRADMRVLGA